MASYPTVTTPYLPTVTGKVITSVDKNGLNPITNMIIKMLEKMRDNLDDTIASATSSYNITVPDSLINSEYDNKIYYSYGESEYPFYTNITGASGNNLFITNTSSLKYKSFNDGDVIRLYQDPVDQGNAIFKPLYSGFTTPYYKNFTYQDSDITQYFAEPYSSTVNRIYAYRGEAGSRTQISSVNNLVLVLKFKGFWTTEIDGDGNYTGSKIFIEQENYLIASIYKLFNRIKNFYFNYMGDEEINLHLFDKPIVVLGSTPPMATSAQIVTEPRMLLQDKIKMFNVIGIPFTLDQDQIQSETFTDGYDPDYKYVEKGNGQPDNEAGGGDGTGDNTEDNFELPTPSINPASAAVKQYVLNSNQVYSFLEELFNGTFWTNSDLLNKNPKESVVSLTAWPINLLNWDLYHVGIPELIQCGNVTMTYAQGQPIQNGYNKIIDVGEYEIKKYYGSFMDYLTKIEIFLPFVGWRSLSTQNVMGRTIKVRYVLNFEDGGIVVYVTSTDGTIERLEQVEQAKLAFDIPIFTSNINEKEKEKLQLLITAAISTASAGMGAMGSGAAGVATAAGKEAVSGANKIFALQEHINGGNVVASNATWYLPNKCILKFTRPRKSTPSGYAKVNGYPANYTAKLANVTGYTEVENPVINGIECTEIERQKIKALLQGGIYL